MMLPNGWEKVRLGDIATISSGSTPLRSNKAYFDNGNMPWVKTMDLTNGKITKTDECITELAAKKCKPYPTGTVLVAMYGGFNQIGRTGLLTFPASINQALAALQFEKDVCSEYVLFYLNANVDRWRSCAASSRKDPNITSHDVEKFKIVMPPLEEQKKIAATLSVWDSAIEKMEKLIEAKEISFNSLLKELIYAPAEKECWNIVKLGDVSEMSSGGTPKSSVEKYYNGDVLWVSIADMTEQGMYIKDTAKKLTKLGVENSAAKIYPKGTVLYAMYASIGEVSIAEKEMASSQAILGIQVSDKLVNKYLYYFLVGQKERIKLQGQAGTQSNLNAGMVKNLDIPIPSIKEQNKIIAVLDNGMDELSLLKQQLENYKKQKQGLMQKLLTGQWRVK